ncbi:MAG: hypothetical protein FJ026_14115 [Chloroflexi bacterium]|nr:hypothetical protein [Chloroflexota bacterium]
MTHRSEGEAGASPARFWGVEGGQEGLSWSCSLLPLTLAGWHAELCYRLGSHDLCESLRLSHTPAKQGQAGHVWSATGTHLELRLILESQANLRLSGVLRNGAGQDAALSHLRLIADDVRLGTRNGRYAFFKNGYQSWTATRSFRAQEQEMLPRLRVFSLQQDNPRNLSSGQQGEFTSDMFSVLANVEEGVFLLLGQAGGFGQFLYIRAHLATRPDEANRLELVYDWGNGVDALRIGPDVAPYWFAKYRYGLMRDPHALCTTFAIRSALNRCQMHRRLWVNDPDCLLLRDTETKLTPDERLSLVHAVIITGGMYVISDRLSRLPDAMWQWMDRIEELVQVCDGGRPWALDYMERETPEAVYNSVGYLAVFNFQERAVQKQVPLGRYLHGVVGPSACWQDVWSGEQFACQDGLLDVGLLRPHASRLLRLR